MFSYYRFWILLKYFRCTATLTECHLDVASRHHLHTAFLHHTKWCTADPRLIRQIWACLALPHLTWTPLVLRTGTGRVTRHPALQTCTRASRPTLETPTSPTWTQVMIVAATQDQIRPHHNVRPRTHVHLPRCCSRFITVRRNKFNGRKNVMSPVFNHFNIKCQIIILTKLSCNKNWNQLKIGQERIEHVPVCVVTRSSPVIQQDMKDEHRNL